MTQPIPIEDWTCRKGHKGNVHVRPDRTKGIYSCRTCANERARASYERHADIRQARNEAYRKKNYERLKAAAAKRYNPTKARAVGAVNYAVKTGKFEKLACQQCSEPKTDFHHTNGYDKDNWFTGVWLCRPHHAQTHKELRWQTSK